MRGGHDTTGITSAVTLGTVQETPPPDQDPPGLPVPVGWKHAPTEQPTPPSPPAAPQRSQPHFCVPRPHLGLLPLSPEELPALGGGLRCRLPHSGPSHVGVRVRCPPRRLLHALRPPRPSAHVGAAPRAPPPRSYWLFRGGGGAWGGTHLLTPSCYWVGVGSMGVLGCRGGTVETKDTGNKGCWGGCGVTL